MLLLMLMLMLFAAVYCSLYVLTGNEERRMRLQNDLPVMRGHDHALRVGS